MPRINVLDYNIINKIAAGEVVERPSSVVKELMENSIDAGATGITVEIKDGGISLIKITDNGCGIPKAEVSSAFLSHATSKLTEIEDLETLMTLGFRGEALSSIASVSQVEMLTKTKDADAGTRIEIHGGETVSIQDAGCANGTVITVRNLFYNTPARRKFLKKPAVEAGYISDIITRLALGNPSVAFKYINNGTILIQTNGKNDLKSVILSIYGKDVAQKLISVDYKGANDYRLTGFIGKPESSRSNRSYESFFINSRFTKSQLMASAVEECYRPRIMSGRFPFFVLNLNAPAAGIDINVHPTKLEVRFSNDEQIYDFIEKAVKKAFESEVLIPKANLTDKPSLETFQNVFHNIPYELYENDKKPLAIHGKMSYNGNIPIATDLAPLDNILDNAVSEQSTAYKTTPEQSPETNADRSVCLPMEESKPFFSNYKIIGQLFNTYWIVEQEGSMYLIDQHAAHEKVLYDEFVTRFKSEGIVSQSLVSPMAVKLNESEYEAVRANIDLLNSFGFELDDFGSNTYAIRSVPNIFNSPSEAGFFMDIVDKLASMSTAVKNIYDAKLDAIAMISCKAAVKGNNRLSYAEAKELIAKILKLENPFNCPHGRPTIIEITKYEIEKMFKRIV